METQEIIASHKIKWKVSLSNGETFYEGKGLFTEYKGELSPWQKLLRYLTTSPATFDGELRITSLSLYTDDGRTFNLPSLGKNPKFEAFTQDFKPFKFVLERKIARDHGEDSTPDWFTVAHAFYNVPKKDHDLNPVQVIDLSLWVDENNPDNCWTLINILEVKHDK